MAARLRRGQSALEYLVTYGWAILVIVIIAGLLWYFGIFNPSRFVGGKQCGGFGAFICQDFKVSTNGSLTIVLNNNVGGTVNAVNITTGTSGFICSPTTVAAKGNATCAVAGVVPAGSTGHTVHQWTVRINYTDARSGISHTDTGFINGKYE